MVWRILKYIQHLFHRRFRNGRRIHSPYLFEFVHEVVFNALKTKVPEPIGRMHRQLREDRTMIPSGSIGATSAVNQSESRSVRSFVNGSSVSQKYGALLYRITRWFKPEMIIELGTGLAISTIYMAAGAPGIPMLTIEGIHDRANFAEGVIKRSGLKGVKVYCGDMDQQLEALLPEVKDRFVAFVDGNHRYDPTIRYVKRLVTVAGEEAVVIMDDIYWSKEMHRAWKEVISWPEIRVSIDLYHMGILLLRRDLHKAIVKINF